MRVFSVVGSVLVLTCVALGCSSADNPTPPSGQADSGSSTCASDDACDPGPCKATVCIQGFCTKNVALDGSPVPTQVAGDCQRVVCNADATTRSIADDSDLPPVQECATVTCEGGLLKSVPAAAGKACLSKGVCDGAGRCVEGVGQDCAKGESCPTGFCVDGVCCNEACAGECRTCTLAGARGICANVPYYQEDPMFVPAGGGVPLTCDTAIAGARCDGNGVCKKTVGSPCTVTTKCMSGMCSGMKCLGAKGEICNGNSQCASNSCSVGACN
ncbi:MAG: hypothetical protein KBF88_11405 [Polyangiaceae bacterium]|nr:hypothetical protein [Polyangiaceae bacterium]